jgi:Kef-type K+ transport system membrane component KefB
MITFPSPLLLAVAVGGEGDVPRLLAVLVAIFLGARLLGELAQRIGQPAVLGELIAGVLLGGSVLGILDPNEPVIYALSEIGVVVLLFETGLHTNLRSLLSVGAAATTVGLAGVVLPFALGTGAALALGVPGIAALVCGAALCATSIGISARVLFDLGQLESREGRVVLGAAVLDDIVGLVILSVVSSIVAGAAVSAIGVTVTATVALLFVVLAVVIGARIAPPAFRVVERIKTAGALGILGLSFAFALAWLATMSGSAMIIGAFAAGLVLNGIPQCHDIERATTSIGHFFVPIFFARVGAAVDLGALASERSLLIGGALIACGIVGKMIAGYVPAWFRGDKLLIGVAMVPRGEVGLIFAGMGLQSGALDPELFGALMLMVLVTTLVTPPALSGLVRRRAAYRAIDLAELPGQGGIDDLVSGTSLSEEEEEALRRARARGELPAEDVS